MITGALCRATVTASVLLGSGCGEGGGDASGPDPRRACTLIGCGPSVVIEFSELDAAPDARLTVTACVEERCTTTRHRPEERSARVYVGVPSSDSRDGAVKVTLAITTSDQRPVARATGEIPVTRTYPNGRGCGECRFVHARLLDDRRTLVPTD